jgi:NAD+ diphosphatase
VLLLRHSYARRKVWDLPGGFVQVSERAVDAVYRELHEELKIEPQSLRCICRETVINDHKRETLLTFVAQVESKEITPSPAEIDEAAWFPVTELPKKATPFVRRMVARASWPEEMLSGLETR